MRVFASQLSTLANCLLVLSLQQDFDHEQVEEVDLLEVRLVAGLVIRVSSQLGSLYIEMILGLGTGEWIVQVEDLRDNWPL